MLTGDNKYNPEADVLIMTTEIYLNTLNKLTYLKKEKSEKEKEISSKLSLDFSIDIETELGIVIHDEVHYINDRDRGHIWEKSIMNQPKHIPYIGLSATIASPEKLCKWSENPNKANRNEISLCQSTFRNVPIYHCSFITLPDSNYKNIKNKEIDMLKENCDKLITLKQQDQHFQEENYNKLKKTLKYIYEKKIIIKDSFIFNKIVQYLKNNNLLPGLIFVFSRKQCHTWAKMIQQTLFEENSKIPTIIEKEAKQILITKLSNWKEYINLPEYRNIIKLLEKGIAVHHSGVTPVFREMIEILYRKQYIKLLIATETFAIGVNVAIKCVVYTGLKKFDGKGFRYLQSHEYAQGAGRAGRRGKDTKGVVIHLSNIHDRRDGFPDAMTYRKMLSGKPQNLKSKFCIDFKLIISMLSTGNTNFKQYINSSMLSNEISNQIDRLELESNDLVATLEKKRNNIQYMKNPINIIKEYHSDKQNLVMVSKKKRKALERKINNTESSYKNIKKDYNTYMEFLDFQKFIKQNEKIMNNTKNYVSDELSLHIEILKNENFVEGEIIDNNYNNIKSTNKGLIASNIHEIHPLACADILNNKDLDNLSVDELISVISIFTPIKLNDEDSYKDIKYTTCNQNIKNAIKNWKNKLDYYYDIETKYQTNFTDSYNIHYNMCEFMYNWCQAENETDCRIIYNEAKKYNIYIGEFVKAILKIVNICSELEKACIVQENIKLLHTLSQVRGKVLKNIATNQTLYV